MEKDIKIINDATKQQAGTIYQYLIALKDCFELDDESVLEIENKGDVTVINCNKGVFQKEVKHHFERTTLSDRNVDLWKTLANWYEEYDKSIQFKHYVLHTTSIILDNSSFAKWDKLSKEEKLEKIKGIGKKKKGKEKKFREQYIRIFGEKCDEEKLIDILDKFTIAPAQTTLPGISKVFSKYIGYIPINNRDYFIGALLGEILIRVKNPPYKWIINKIIFDEILQRISPSYIESGTIPLPNEYVKAEVPKDAFEGYYEKKFVKAIKEIDYEEEVANAILNYWKANMTIASYFRDDFIYLDSIESYKMDLENKMQYTKKNMIIKFENKSEKEKIKNSKVLYNDIMLWEAKDFGSIIRNRDFFQQGVIHNIVEETGFRWKLEEKRNEHK